MAQVVGRKAGLHVHVERDARVDAASGETGRDGGSAPTCAIARFAHHGLLLGYDWLESAPIQAGAWVLVKGITCLVRSSSA